MLCEDEWMVVGQGSDWRSGFDRVGGVCEPAESHREAGISGYGHAALWTTGGNLGPACAGAGDALFGSASGGQPGGLAVASRPA
jgi:hypothetical protein